MVREHQQCCYEISYIVSGKGRYIINRESYNVQEGDIILNAPGEFHACIADEIHPFRYFYVGFDLVDHGLEESPFAIIRNLFDHPLKPVLPDKVGIETPFIRIFSEIINLNDFSSFMIETYLRQLLVLAYRNYYESWEDSHAPSTGIEATKQLVYEMINYMDTNLSQINELTRIADQFHYSYSYLSHVFSKAMGITIKEYYNNKRFEQAIDMLKRGKVTVTQIAEELKYQSIHTFSRAFRKRFGLSPTEYQQITMIAKNAQADNKNG